MPINCKQPPITTSATATCVCKATGKAFAHLDSRFITHRNPKAIQQMQQKVVDYEQALQRQAELLLQQERIQQEQRELKKRLKEKSN